MVDPRNIGTLVGGLVEDPKRVGNDGQVLKLTIGVDRAGNDQNSDNNSGYFDLTYFLNSKENSNNASFVKSQLESGNLSKGSQVHIVYSLQHDRWEKDGEKRSKVGLIAEAITYYGAKRDLESNGHSSAPASQQKAVADNSVPHEF